MVRIAKRHGASLCCFLTPIACSNVLGIGDLASDNVSAGNAGSGAMANGGLAATGNSAGRADAVGGRRSANASGGASGAVDGGNSGDRGADGGGQTGDSGRAGNLGGDGPYAGSGGGHSGESSIGSGQYQISMDAGAAGFLSSWNSLGTADYAGHSGYTFIGGSAGVGSQSDDENQSGRTGMNGSAGHPGGTSVSDGLTNSINAGGANAGGANAGGANAGGANAGGANAGGANAGGANAGGAGMAGSSGFASVFNLATDLIGLSGADTSGTTWRLISARRVPEDPNVDLQYLVPVSVLSAFRQDAGACPVCEGQASWTPNGAYAPMVAVNRSFTPFVVGTQQVPSRSVYGHPGQNGEYVDVQWIAPAAGRAAVWARFVGLDNTTTDVHVLACGRQVAFSYISGFDIQGGYQAAFEVRPGDTIEFAVGPGTTLNYNNDSTQIDVEVALTPQ